MHSFNNENYALRIKIDAILYHLQILCASCFIISLMFAHGAGSYIFQLMDSFAGSYSLLIIAFFECIAVAYVYGIKR